MSEEEFRNKGIEIPLVITAGQLAVLKDIQKAKATVQKSLEHILPSSFPIEANHIMGAIWDHLDDLIINWKKWVIADFNLKLDENAILDGYHIRAKNEYWER